MTAQERGSDRLIRLPEVKRKVGLGKTMIYALIGDGRFPRPYKLTPATACWSEREVDAWIAGVIGTEVVRGCLITPPAYPVRQSAFPGPNSVSRSCFSEHRSDSAPIRPSARAA